MGAAFRVDADFFIGEPCGATDLISIDLLHHIVGYGGLEKI
jgi:hypothetical protein